jgi:hypothetical protein
MQLVCPAPADVVANRKAGKTQLKIRMSSPLYLASLIAHVGGPGG